MDVRPVITHAEHDVLGLFFVFFKQKTAYEIKECDWSSDVCSSDLCECPRDRRLEGPQGDRRIHAGNLPKDAGEDREGKAKEHRRWSLTRNCRARPSKAANWLLRMRANRCAPELRFAPKLCLGDPPLYLRRILSRTWRNSAMQAFPRIGEAKLASSVRQIPARSASESWSAEAANT